MSYQAFLKPRPEVLSEEIEGIIDLANLKDSTGARLEARPADFLDLTYPTSDIAKVIEQINFRFSSTKPGAGLFLFEGLKGSGKSHLLLTVYHLLNNPHIAQNWLRQNGFSCSIPSDATVIVNKFTDEPHDSLWEMIFSKLGVPTPKGKTHPKLPDLQTALGNRQIVLIFDELEQGIKVINDPSLVAQNIAFLQMISEFSNRSRQITIFASIYSDREEPGSTLKRVPRCVVQFDENTDQSNILLHRLFSNYRSFNKSLMLPVIDSYLQIWQKHVPFDIEEQRRLFQISYPFSPSLLDILLKKIPSRGGFQNVRGALSFLGNLVRLTHDRLDIVTPADICLSDKPTTIMLKDLDPSGDLINRAIENMNDLKTKAALSEKIAPAALIYTITGMGGNMGITHDQLVQDILTPSISINTLEHSLMAFQKYATYFWCQEGRYYFDLEENPEAKIEFKSTQYSDAAARDKLYDLLKNELFRQTENVCVYDSTEQVKESLNQADKNRPRYLFAGRRLTQEERHDIYFGQTQRNLILLLEPKDNHFQLAADKDLLKWSKRILAAKELNNSVTKPARASEYDRIARSDQSYILERIKKAGLVLVNWECYGSMVAEDQIELEPLPADFSKDNILEKLSQDYFPTLTFKNHLESRLEEITDRLVKEIDLEYRSTLGFPVPVHVTSVSSAIRSLCKDGLIGIQHGAGNYCHINPGINETELLKAKITPPFESPPPPAFCQICRQSPCQCRPHICSVCHQNPCQCQSIETVCSVCLQNPCICQQPVAETVQIRIAPQNSINMLRQQTAFRLQEFENGVIARASYQIFYQQCNIGDISSLPSSLRGAMSGQGDVMAEITISKTGQFTKAQIETQIESLPMIPDAEYALDLSVETE
jgi:hypothetical protein